MEARGKVRRRSWILLTCAIDSLELVAPAPCFGRAEPPIHDHSAPEDHPYVGPFVNAILRKRRFHKAKLAVQMNRTAQFGVGIKLKRSEAHGFAMVHHESHELVAETT